MRSLFYFMPVRKHYECVDSFNTIKLRYNDAHLVLVVEKEAESSEEAESFEILLDRNDLLEMIQDLETINEILY